MTLNDEYLLEGQICFRFVNVFWWPDLVRLDTTLGDTVVGASLVAKFQRSRILMKRFRWNIQLFHFCLSPCYWGQLLWSDLDEWRSEGASRRQREGEAEMDGETALHPRHLNKMSTVLLASRSLRLFVHVASLFKAPANDAAAVLHSSAFLHKIFISEWLRFKLRFFICWVDGEQSFLYCE